MRQSLEPFLFHQLRDRDQLGKLALAAEFLSDGGAPFEQEIIDRLLSEIIRTDRKALLSWVQTLPANPSAAYLRARLAAEVSDLASSAAHWEQFFNLTPQRDPFLLLAYARVLADLGRSAEASLHLARALSPVPKYAFFTRAAKLVKALAGSGSHLRQSRVAVLGTSGTSLLIPVFEALCARDRIAVEIYEGLYGSVDQEILDPASGLARFQPNVVFIVTNWRSLQLPAVLDDEAGRIAQIVSQHVSRWRTLSDRFGCHVVQHAFDFPAEEPYGYLAASLPGGRARCIELLNLRLREEAPSYVSVLDTPALQRETGAAKWQDAMQWHSFQQHPSTEALPALADAMAAHLRAVLGLTRKVLVTDLDNTLWKGVIGEDGLEGIKIGPGSPAGEAHARLQQYILDLKARGVLLAVASKNNPEDAVLPFHKHPHMLLRREDFAAFEANWNDKASSIREIARQLSLGLDSFVFIDDNPLEREWVRSQIPEAAVIELGPSVFHYAADLDRGRPFFAISLSAEDRVRAEQYRDEAARKHLQATAQSLDEFLAQLQLRAWWGPVDGFNLARVTQLTNKTNQFNLTTRRYTEAQVQQLAQDARCWTAAFHLADRMGEYGLIGLIFCRAADSADEWEIDTWLMSCRVLGRQMEKYMFDRLVEAAQSRGVRRILGVYRPTQKNRLVEDHYAQLGFEQIAATPEDIRYRLAVPADAILSATHIRDESGALSAAL